MKYLNKVVQYFITWLYVEKIYINKLIFNDCFFLSFQFLIVLIVLVMRKRIALVIQLFKEAGKAVHSMPVLLLQPIYVSFYLFNRRQLLTFKIQCDAHDHIYY